MNAIELSDRCPCGSGEQYQGCCHPLHSGARTAATATALMRSRYCAFVLGNADYLLATWHPSTRPAQLDLESGRRWLGLEIVAAAEGGPFHDSGTVEFRARYLDGRRRGEQHERSAFTRVNGKWLYLTGDSRF